MANVLWVDDEQNILSVMERSLKKRGHEVRTATDGPTALELLSQWPAEVVFTDLRMEPMDGMELLEKIQAHYPGMKVIVVTAYDDVQTAVEAMKKGAWHFLAKGFDLADVDLLLERLRSELSLRSDNARLQEALSRKADGWELVGESRAMANVRDLIVRVAVTDATVLIRGESGTGKELSAKAIHKESKRRSRPFIPVNCAAMPDTLLESELFGYVKGAFTGAEANKKGLFELAHKGTIFLDEVGEANASVQAKLLRVLEERRFMPVGGTAEVEVDVRIVVATHRALEKMIMAGEFREDLYYRFNVFPIDLPPLRERLDDLELLLARLLGELGRDMEQFDRAALPALRGYHWPGNVRELRNVLERAHILAGPESIHVNHVQLPRPAQEQGLGGDAPANLNLEDHERRLIGLALKRAKGNKTRAAEMLGLTRRALYSRLERLSIPADGEES